MPTAKQFLTIIVVAVVVALVVTFVFRLLGLGQNATAVAGITGAVSGTTAVAILGNKEAQESDSES